MSRAYRRVPAMARRNGPTPSRAARHSLRNCAFCAVRLASSPMTDFDHFAIAAATLDDGAAHVFARLGHHMGPGGKHALMSTHNRLSGLAAGEYFEVIAIDPDAAAPDRPRWFDLDRRAGLPRIGNWILRTDDLDALVDRLPQAGRPLSFARGAFRWRMAVPDDGILPYDGCFPALIQWDSPAPTFPES